MTTNTTAEIVDRRCAYLGEGPVWLAASEELLWIDIVGGHLHWADGEGRHLRSVTVGGDVGVALPAEDGSILLATDRGLAIWDDANGVREVDDLLARDPDQRFNDGKVDPAGRALVGTMSCSGERGTSYFARIDTGPSVTPLLDGVSCSNGLDWSEDGQRFYYIDTHTHRVDVFDYDLQAGTLANRRPFVEMPREWGYPDGMCADTDGGLWVAFSGGGCVRRFDADGAVDVVVDVPVPGVTSCAFGGADLRTLFITTTQINVDPTDLEGRYADSGSLYSVRTGHRGRRPTLWRRQDFSPSP